MYDYDRATEWSCNRFYRSKAKRYLMLAADPHDPKHGTKYAYDVGCRCQKCIDAGRAYYRERKRKNGRDHP